MGEQNGGTAIGDRGRRGDTRSVSRPRVLEPEQLRNRIYDIMGEAFPTREIDPFWMRLFDGSLPLDGVRHWAKEMHFITQELGRYRSAIHANCPHFEVRHLLARALYEEHGELRDQKDRPTLFRKFTASIGISEQDLAVARPLPETEALLDWLLDLCLHGHFVKSLAGFGVAVEGHLNKSIPMFIHVFRDQHGLGNDAVEFWTARAEEGLAQGRRALEIVLRYADTPTLQADVLEAVRKSMERLMMFHHGVGRWYRTAQLEERLAVNA
jgi:pyrroloquinoline-quinone synthase